MTITSGIFNSVNGDRKYNAQFFAQYFSSFIGNGVFPNPSNNLQVIADSNMKTVVKPGKGWINGYYVYNDSDHVLQHDVANGLLARIDRVVMRLNNLTRQIEITIKKGTNASVPIAPTLQRDSDYYELALADIRIVNGMTSITQANILDLRMNTTFCGVVHGTVNQVDTTTIFNQYNSWFNTYSSTKQQEFENWFEEIQDILSGDVASNLLSRIMQNETNLTGLQQQITTHSNDYMTHGITATTSGSANTYTLSLNPALTVYQKNLHLTLFFNVANTGTATININGLGAKALKKNDGSDFDAGDITTDAPYSFVYNGTSFLANSGSGEVKLTYKDYFTTVTGIDANVPNPEALFTPSVQHVGGNLKSEPHKSYAVFGGGYNAEIGYKRDVTAYNYQLVRFVPTYLSQYKALMACTCVNGKLLFAGGHGAASTNNLPTSMVEVYDDSLTRTTGSSLATARYVLSAGTIGNYAIFAGGYTSNNSNQTTNAVDIYNGSLTKLSATQLSYSRGSMASVSTGAHVIFAGGDNFGEVSSVVEAYNSSLVKTNASSLQQARYRLGGAVAGTNAIFASGSTGAFNGIESSSTIVDGYNTSLTKTSLSPVSVGRSLMGSASGHGYAMFAGGYEYVSNVGKPRSSTDAYNASMTRIATQSLEGVRGYVQGASVAGTLLFAGGGQNDFPISSNTTDKVTAYGFTGSATIHIPPRSKYKFNEVTEIYTDIPVTKTYNQRVNGYVKTKSQTISPYI